MKKVTAKTPPAGGKPGNKRGKKTKYFKLPVGVTEKGPPGAKRPYYTAGPNRDRPVESVRLEKTIGKRPGYDTIADHLNPNKKADPNAKLDILTRSQNSRKDGGRRFRKRG
jgi:hypothetical protein